jgi:glucose-6-phosphate dehydrogenase assembly protein OpcA
MAGAVTTNGPVAVERWQQAGAQLSDVLTSLGDLRRRAAGQGASMRTAVMTLVVVDGTDSETDACVTSVRALGSHHPCRLVMLKPDPDSTPSIDAEACLWRTSAAQGGDGAPDHPIFFEELHLRVGGQAASHLASIVGPFALADMPLVLWFPGPLPDPADPLLRVATALLVDTRVAGSDASEVAHAYRTLLELANHHPVVDLSWVRLQPWRELLAGLFDPEQNRAMLKAVRSAQVKGKPGPRYLLGGWLLAQLDLRARQVALEDARHVEITVNAGTGGNEGTFIVSRDEGTRAVWARAVLSGGVAHSQGLPLPDDSLTSALSAAMGNLRADAVWERALAAATTLGA